jgi:hypothetical protein
MSAPYIYGCDFVLTISGRCDEGSWTSDCFEILRWNGEPVRVAFALDTCDWTHCLSRTYLFLLRLS